MMELVAGQDAGAKHEFTQLLLASKQGSPSALQALMPLVEAELRRLAGGYMRNERAGHTLQPTALVNEAWMHMAQEAQPEYQCRSHFIAIAAQYMRQILMQHARKKNAAKRGAGARPVELDDQTLFALGRSSDLLALDDGLKDLAVLDGRQAQIVELHFFGGLTYEEIAEYLGIGRSTVIRDLRMAQRWLKDYLGK
jgi:RNA polymerase sigma factor (TIGR02999 family)